MNNDDDLSELESRMRAKLGAMQAKPTSEDAKEKAMVARLLGSKTEADQFYRHEGRKPLTLKSRIDIRRPKTFKPRAPVIRYEFFDRPSSDSSMGGWTIEKFEDGVKVEVRQGSDYLKRDEAIIRNEAAGFQCKPIAIGDRLPIPVQGRMRDRQRQPSGKSFIMSKIGKLTTDDIAAIEPSEEFDD